MSFGLFAGYTLVAGFWLLLWIMTMGGPIAGWERELYPVFSREPAGFFISIIPISIVLTTIASLIISRTVSPWMGVVVALFPYLIAAAAILCLALEIKLP